MSNKGMTKLSASRIKTAQSCSWLYHCKYKLKLPDKTNDGASRGTVCHLILEVLAKKGRKRYYNDIIKSKTIFSVPSVGRLATIWAHKLNVSDPENIKLIDYMTVNGLEHDYFGKDLDPPTHSFSEKKFDMEINNGSKSYRINGFIDKLFLYKGKKAALIRDFKTSKKVFEGKEIEDNLQDLMYSLAVKHLYPEYSFRQSEFLFLKFELGHDLLGENNEGVLQMQPLSDEELEGFEYQLTEWQNYLDSFDEEAAYSDFAFDRGFPEKHEGFSGKLLCGFAKYPGQLKKDGSPMWHCSYKFGFNYSVVKDKDGKLKRSAFEEDRDSLVEAQEDGDTIEDLYYEGCPCHSQAPLDTPTNDEFSL